MRHVRQILVPVDFSENSARALEYAAELARLSGATVEVLHVWSVPAALPQETLVVAGSGAVKLIELVQSQAEAELLAFVSAAAGRGAIVTRTRTEPGIASRVILEAVKAGAYDLIVMGTRGRNSFSDVLLGSVAERVVRRARCPVITVRSEASPRRPGKILVPVDFSERTLPVLRWAGELARRTGARIDAIHVWQMPTFIRPSTYWETGSDEERLTAYLEAQMDAHFDELSSKAAECDVTISKRRIERGEPFRVILDVAESGDYDLIAMGTRGRTGVDRVLGSVAARVMQHAPCPVMTVAEGSG